METLLNIAKAAIQGVSSRNVITQEEFSGSLDEWTESGKPLIIEIKAETTEHIVVQDTAFGTLFLVNKKKRKCVSSMRDCIQWKENEGIFVFLTEAWEFPGLFKMEER